MYIYDFRCHLISSYVILHYLTIYLSFFVSFRLNCSVGSSDMDFLSSLLWLDNFLSFEISIKALRVVVTEHYYHLVISATSSQQMS